MKKFTIILSAIVFVAALNACHGNKNASGKDSTGHRPDTNTLTTAKPDSAANTMGDTAFASKAAVGGMAEVALGKMAISKSNDSKIKDFATMMIDEHGKANADLNSIAKNKNLKLPSTLDADHQAKIDSLGKLSGKDFEKAYVVAMIDGHQKTLALMQNEAQNGKDPDLKNFAARTAPVVRMHLAAIQKVQNNMK